MSSPPTRYSNSWTSNPASRPAAQYGYPGKVEFETPQDAAVTGQPTHAASLFGAAATLAERASIASTTGPRTAYARSRPSAEKQLGTDAFSSAWDVSPRAGVALTSGLAAKGLTPRQLDVLRLVADGKTDRQIAAELVLSEKTVGRHTENIFARLGVTSRAAASVVALRQGLA